MIICLFIISCSDNETNNFPPRDFNVIAVKSDFNNITFRWTESTDPENSIIKYNAYIAKNIDSSEYELVAANITEELVVGADVINVNGQNISIDPPEDPEFKFVYIATNLTHNTNYKIKIIAHDQEGNQTISYLHASTQKDNFYPSVYKIKNEPQRYYTKLDLDISDNSSDNQSIELYLNGNLHNTYFIENQFDSRVFIVSELTESTSYNGRIFVTDNNGNMSVPYDFEFTTFGNTYIGDLEFSEQEEIDLFATNNYLGINGNLTITNSHNFTNFNAFNTLEIVSGNISIANQSANESPPTIGFETLNKINGDLVLHNFNPSDIFNNLKSVTGTLEIDGPKQSDSQSIFEVLTSVGNLEINENYYDTYPVHELRGFNSLVKIDGKLSISSTDLRNINFLVNVIEINNGIQINDNYILTDFCGLEIAINSNGLIGNYSISLNAYNPTVDDIVSGNCSQ